STNKDEGTEPLTLEQRKSKKELVQQLRLARQQQQQTLDEQQAAAQKETPSNPPLAMGYGFEPIREGDWIANTEFVRIVPDREFRNQVNQELLSLRDVNL